MYIKPNVIGAFTILATSCHGIDFSAHVNLGMTTNQYQLVALNHLTSDQISEYRKTVVSEDRMDVANSIGYNMPEFFDLYAFGDFSPLPEVTVQPYVNAKLLDYRIDLGVESSYSAHYFNNALRLKGFLNAYHSLFVKEISYSEPTVNLDAGAKVDVSMSPYFSVYIELKHPFLSGFNLEVNKLVVPVSNIPSVSIGASVNILTEYSSLQDDNSPMIIQEPISIPVVEIKIEEPKVEVMAPEIVIKTPQITMDDEPEELGWFAWIIEFIAKLFRF